MKKIRKGFMEMNRLTVSTSLSEAMLAEIHRSANRRFDIPEGFPNSVSSEVQEYREGILELERFFKHSNRREH